MEKISTFNNGMMLSEMFSYDSTLEIESDTYKDILMAWVSSHTYYEECVKTALTAGDNSNILLNNINKAKHKLMESLDLLIGLMKSYLILEHDILKYYENLLEERGLLEVYMTDDPLTVSHRYAVHSMIYDEQRGQVNKRGLRLKDPEKPYNFIDIGIDEYAKSIIWLYIKQMTIGNIDDVHKEQERIMIVWLLFMSYLVLMNYEPKTIYIDYIQWKNQ